MAIGSMLRAPRISPDVALHFEGWTIPKGTPVSMSSYWMHRDAGVFPNPGRFEPERWFCRGVQLRIMQSHYVPFAKGSRACMGQNLVYMQLYHTLAELYRPGAPRLRLFQTDASDVVPKHGLLFPFPRLASVGVRVAVESRAD
ncbi:hypothetical protein LOZ33_003366 [Ophidiomyces ophidiicola]|nr:hypothetical protein LOZ33_003366 [Ophidiomyces ophidiicola]